MGARLLYRSCPAVSQICARRESQDRFWASETTKALASNLTKLPDLTGTVCVRNAAPVYAHKISKRTNFEKERHPRTDGRLSPLVKLLLDELQHNARLADCALAEEDELACGGDGNRCGLSGGGHGARRRVVVRVKREGRACQSE